MTKHRKKMMMMKIGKNVSPELRAFKSLYDLQMKFQHSVTGIITPIDMIEWFVYHMAAMQEELGEVLKADKRWKTHRNTKYDPENKIDELADVFITAMNLSIYSGFTGEEIAKAIENKINENVLRLERRKKDDSNC